MTALKEYARLECLGLWKEHADAQRIEVVVAFGDASLVLRDSNDRPLTHWSMAAIERLNPTQRPAIYSADPDAGELLEIEDKTMIKAIERIRARIQRSRAKPGRLRMWISLFILFGFISVCVAWLPDAIARYATRIIPDAKIAEINQRSLARVRKFTGTPCNSPYGQRALRLLQDRLIGSPTSRIMIVEMGQRKSALLPGGDILINKSLLSDKYGPDVLAGYVLQERAQQDDRPAIYDLFSTSGTKTTLKFLATGEIEPNSLDSFAEHQITTAKSRPSVQTLAGLFDLAQLSSDAYIKHEPTYVELKNLVPQIDKPVTLLSDEDWLALQEICD